MHEVLVNRLGGLSLPRKSVVRLTDHPDMTLDVYRGRKTTMQHVPISLISPMLSQLRQKVFCSQCNVCIRGLTPVSSSDVIFEMMTSRKLQNDVSVYATTEINVKNRTSVIDSPDFFTN